MSVLTRSFLFLLLLCLPILTEAKRQSGEGKPEKPRQPPTSSPPAKRARNRSVPGSGELTTKEGHRCIWQTSGEGMVSLLVNCTTETLGDQQRYWCRYAGKPDLCQAYGVKSSQYWKQLVGKLKKRQNACDGEKVLKAKTCKKAPAEAHMKLAQRSGEEEKKGGKEGGKKRVAPASKNSDGGKSERKKKKEEEEEEEKKKKEEEERTGFDDEGLVNDMEPVQSYCSEGWHSVCSFFVKFFEG
ncbi:fibroblast growth factor-binding protein 3 [Epinephelus fuscoguttatus]|uniref:fibroblast growth factor-binding protein 3 n=1 Tax=Epinephelus fuscoguttatus TaxID=293821 RepID=UPI0020D05EC9|nr:fibroblast growth factor-binding protein 3 [Epinephelus fuscoguttatus]XP_049927119.1 fibroblast growth factor-binding protein 3 [Epinephelus moara]